MPQSLLLLCPSQHFLLHPQQPDMHGMRFTKRSLTAQRRLEPEAGSNDVMFRYSLEPAIINIIHCKIVSSSGVTINCCLFLVLVHCILLVLLNTFRIKIWYIPPKEACASTLPNSAAFAYITMLSQSPLPSRKCLLPQNAHHLYSIPRSISRFIG